MAVYYLHDHIELKQIHWDHTENNLLFFVMSCLIYKKIKLSA
jgi:hypothetical protein